MIYRSLNENQREVSFYDALRLGSYPRLVLLKGQTSTCISWADDSTKTYHSLQGSEKEVSILRTLQSLLAQSVPVRLLYVIPHEFKELREGLRSRRACFQAVKISVMLNGLELPIDVRSRRDFKKWLETITV